MSNMNIDSRIQNFAKINNISEDEAKKRLEQEEIIEEQDTVEPYSQGQKLDKESLEALTYAGMISKIGITKTEEYTLNGIKFTVGLATNGRFKYVEKEDGSIAFSGSTAVITIKEVTNPDINITLSGTNMTLNCLQTVNSIKNTGLNSVINGSDGADNITSTGIGAIINAGAGNDTIKSTGIRTTIRGGSGNDTISASGIKTNVFGNAGNDNIDAKGINIFADAGSQNDEIKISGINANAVANDGDNKIEGSGVNITAIGGAGKDDINLSGSQTKVENTDKSDKVIVNNRVIQVSSEPVYDENGFDENGIHRDTQTKYDKNGYDVDGYDKDGWPVDEHGNNKFTGTQYDKDGYDRNGINADGYDRQNRFYVNGVLADGLIGEGEDALLYQGGILADGEVGEGVNKLMYQNGKKFTGDIETATDNTKTISSYEVGKLVEQSIETYDENGKIKQEDSTFDNQNRITSNVVTTYDNNNVVGVVSKNYEYREDGRTYLFESDTKGNITLYINNALANETVDGVTYVNGIAQTDAPIQNENEKKFNDEVLPLLESSEVLENMDIKDVNFDAAIKSIKKNSNGEITSFTITTSTATIVCNINYYESKRSSLTTTVEAADGTNIRTTEYFYADGSLKSKSVNTSYPDGSRYNVSEDYTQNGMIEDKTEYREDVNGNDTWTYYDLDDNNELYVNNIHFSGKDADGNSCSRNEYFYPDGSLESKSVNTTYKDGSRYNLSESYTDDGLIEDKTEYREDIDGNDTWTYYNLNDNNELYVNNIYFSGKDANGDSCSRNEYFYADGSLKSKTVNTSYKDGSRYNVSEDYKEDGSISDKSEYACDAEGYDLWVEYDLDDNKQLYTNYKYTISKDADGNNISLTERFYPDGSVKSKDVNTTFVNGSRYNLSESYFEDGSIKDKSEYTCDVDGNDLWVEYALDDDDNLYLSYKYSISKDETGATTSHTERYYPDGSLKSMDKTVTQVNGEKTSISEEYEIGAAQGVIPNAETHGISAENAFTTVEYNDDGTMKRFIIQTGRPLVDPNVPTS